MKKIHIMGAPGSGVSTLGEAIAKQLSIPFFDADNFVWYTEDALRYRRRRNTEHRTKLLAEALKSSEAWVLSGSICGWGDGFVEQFDRVIYLNAPSAVRLERIAQREKLRYGAQQIAAGGALYEVYTKFMLWVANYEYASISPSANLRNAPAEHRWLTQNFTTDQVLRLEAIESESEILNKALHWLAI
jgi:adenylate kinase family enzyme